MSSFKEFPLPAELRSKIHIDMYDRATRELWAQRFDITGERLRKAVRMVGTRITTVAAYLGQPIPLR